MESSRSSYQPKEIRVSNLREVALGYAKKIAQDEARRCPQCAQAACVPGCPLGIDIPGFIRLLREGDAALALDRIKKDNPFPAICGRICPAPCEKACIFEAEGNPIGIRALERFAADYGQGKMEKQILTPGAQQVAIIGSGPSGMSAAYYLAKAGVKVTVFECLAEPGGLLRYAIPEFRLPQKILDEQFHQLTALGVDIQTNVVVGRTLGIEEIFKRGFNAVLLALGAGVPLFSNLPGENLGGVYYNMEFLTRVHDKGKELAFQEATGMIHGSKTVVLGLDPTAFDAARLALRFGQQVSFVFPCLEEKLDIRLDLLKAAVEEGLVIQSPLEVLEILGNDAGFVSGVRCLKLEIVEGPAGLKLHPTREEVILEAQTVIIAHGQRPNSFIRQHLSSLKFDNDGSVWVDRATGMTSIDKIFACGTIVTGGGYVVDAIQGGKVAAGHMNQYLNRG